MASAVRGYDNKETEANPGESRDDWFDADDEAN